MGLEPIVFVILAAFMCATPASAGTCPDPALDETADDCPWADVARGLQSAADTNQDLDSALANLTPRLRADLIADSAREDLKALWGKSINYDEYAHATIVRPEILDLFVTLFRAPARQDRIVHAGMEHTYGYLFSTLLTSFGYKRARWVQDDIEAGFDLPRGALGPTPDRGTLFSNVTYFAGEIAFRNSSARLVMLAPYRDSRPEALRDFDFTVLKPIRLEETVTLSDERTVKLRTDLVPFTGTTGANSDLLVYSFDDTSEDGPKLITAFPVAQSFVDQVVNPAGLGDSKTVITRYNGYVSGVTGQKFEGSRKIVDP